MRELECLVARYCAATLLSDKTGSMFTVCRKRYGRLRSGIGRLRRLLHKQGAALRVFDTPNNLLIYVYRPEKLKSDLAAEPARAILADCGYHADALDFLQTRLLNSDGFPHEIGLFLGYPPRDVAGFIEHGGAKSILTGPWKVYHDVERAQCLFCIYRQCRAHMLQLIAGGMSLQEILQTA
ncbi:MAG: DUF3793 family protein [Christensenellales bacterium]